MFESKSLVFKFNNDLSYTGKIGNFKNLKEMRSFLTLQKLEILSALSDIKPNSVYELAKILEREIAAVQRDCITLEEKGLIILKKSESNRGSLIPKLKKDFTKIKVHLPKMSYEISFKASEQFENL